MGLGVGGLETRSDSVPSSSTFVRCRYDQWAKTMQRMPTDVLDSCSRYSLVQGNCGSRLNTHTQSSERMTNYHLETYDAAIPIRGLQWIVSESEQDLYFCEWERP